MSSDSTSSSSIVTRQRPIISRKKIVIKKIENKASLQVTFTKRRGGLFRKAKKLSDLSGAKVAIIAFSPFGRPFDFAHPSSVESVLSLLESTSTATALHGRSHDDYEDDGTESSTVYQITCPGEENHSLDLNLECNGGMGSLREEHQEMVENESASRGGRFWWEQPIEKMKKLHELKKFRSSLEELRDKVDRHMDEMTIRRLAARDFFGVNPN